MMKTSSRSLALLWSVRAILGLAVGLVAIAGVTTACHGELTRVSADEVRAALADASLEDHPIGSGDVLEVGPFRIEFEHVDSCGRSVLSPPGGSTYLGCYVVRPTSIGPAASLTGGDATHIGDSSGGFTIHHSPSTGIWLVGCTQNNQNYAPRPPDAVWGGAVGGSVIGYRVATHPKGHWRWGRILIGAAAVLLLLASFARRRLFPHRKPASP